MWTGIVALVGVVIGGFLSQWTAIKTAQASRKLELERRRDERLTDVYTGLAKDMHLWRIAEVNARRDGQPLDEYLERTVNTQERSAWAAKVALFASPTVQDLWHEWIFAYNEVMPGERGKPNRDARLEDPQRRLHDQMRSELASSQGTLGGSASEALAPRQ
jgi:hypothetical protein